MNKDELVISAGIEERVFWLCARACVRMCACVDEEQFSCLSIVMESVFHVMNNV